MRLISTVVVALTILIAGSAHAANVIEFTTPTEAVTLDALCNSVAQPIPPYTFVVNHFKLTRGATVWETTALSQAGFKGWVQIDPALPSGFYMMETWTAMVDTPNTGNVCKSALRPINVWPDINQHPSPPLKPKAPQAQYYLW